MFIGCTPFLGKLAFKQLDRHTSALTYTHIYTQARTTHAHTHTHTVSLSAAHKHRHTLHTHSMQVPPCKHTPHPTPTHPQKGVGEGRKGLKKKISHARQCKTGEEMR